MKNKFSKLSKSSKITLSICMLLLAVTVPSVRVANQRGDTPRVAAEQAFIPTVTPGLTGQKPPFTCPACNWVTYTSSENKYSGKNFIRAFLPGLYAPSQNLSNSNFTGATLRQAVLTVTNLTNTNFTNVDFTGADLNGSTTTGATFTGAIWDNTTCPDGTNSSIHGNTCEGHLQ